MSAENHSENSSTTVLDNPSESTDEVIDSGPFCEKCEASFAGVERSACPYCGWYPAAGVFVEIDQEWEAACSGEFQTSKKKSMLEVWQECVPGWIWPLIGCFAVGIGGSVAVRLCIEDEAARGSWATNQLVIALAIQIICHFFANFVMSIDDPDIGVFDAIISPSKSWRRMFFALPKRLWIFSIAVVALSGILGAKYIIGGVNFDYLLDWGITPPAKKNLLNAIAKSAPAGNNDMSMDEALDSFADDAAVRGGGDNPFEKKTDPNKPFARKKTDALILGYELDSLGAIGKIYIAAEVNGRLIYSGRVTPTLSPDENIRLLERFRQSHAPRPVVTAPEGPQWVRPRFTCRVTYEKRVESGRLQSLVWDEMLGEVQVPW